MQGEWNGKKRPHADVATRLPVRGQPSSVSMLLLSCAVVVFSLLLFIHFTHLLLHLLQRLSIYEIISLHEFKVDYILLTVLKWAFFLVWNYFCCYAAVLFATEGRLMSSLTFAKSASLFFSVLAPGSPSGESAAVGPRVCVDLPGLGWGHGWRHSMSSNCLGPHVLLKYGGEFNAVFLCFTK